MHFILTRYYTPVAVLGTLRPVGKDHLHYSWCVLERPWFGNMQNKSCIPEGTYVCRRDEEGKYIGYWEVQNVPNRTEIIMGHVGNKVEDVSGCMALGRDFDFRLGGLHNSEDAVKSFLHHTRDESSIGITICQYHPDFTDIRV